MNDGTIGAPRRVEELRDVANSLRDAALLTTPRMRESKEYQVLIKNLNKLSGADAGPNGRVSAQTVNNAILVATNIDELGNLTKTLSSVIADTKSGVSASYQTELENARAAVNSFLDSSASAPARLNSRISELGTTISTVSADLEKPQSRTAEVLKRLAVGFIVSSFLLAVLRYSAGLYKEQHTQLIRTEEAELATRKFYIAFRCADRSPEQQKLALSSFLAGESALAQSEGKQSPEKDQDTEMIKQILSILAKKL